MVSHLLSSRHSNPSKEKLQRARNVLNGLDDQGRKVSPTMFDDDVISFAHGEGMQRPSPASIAAGIRGLMDTEESTLDNYFFLKTYAPLIEKIRKDFIEMGIDEEMASNICEDSGGMRLFCGFLNAVSNPGDIFLTAQTFYHSITGVCDFFRTQLVAVETRPENSYKLRASDLKDWIEKNQGLVQERRVKALMLFNPTMTGAVYTKNENEDLAALAKQYDLLIVCDAVFSGTEFNGIRSNQIASLPDARDRTVTLNGVAKTMALANIRYGWACGPKEIIDRMRSYSVATGLTVPQVTKMMVNAAFEDKQLYLEANRKECMERVKLIRREVDDFNVSICRTLNMGGNDYKFFKIGHDPIASHSLLLHINGFNFCKTPAGEVIHDSADIVRFMLQSAKVAPSPGIGFGFDDCTVRLAYACMGADRTYKYTKQAELRAAFRQVTDGFYQDTEIPDFTEGYKEGRTLISEAFARLRSAFKDLALSNAPLIRQQVSPRREILTQFIPI